MLARSYFFLTLFIFLSSVSSQRTSTLTLTKWSSLVRTPEGQVFLWDDYERIFGDNLNEDDEIITGRRCNISGDYCLRYDTCRLRSTVDKTGGKTVDRTECFPKNTQFQNFSEFMLPFIVTLYGIMILLLIYSEKGMNIRDHFKYKIFYHFVRYCFPLNSNSNTRCVRRIHERMTFNPRIENLIHERLMILRRRRRATQQEVFHQIQNQIETRENMRNMLISDIITGQVQVKLMLKKKIHNEKILKFSSDEPLSCSICLNEIEDGNLVGDIPCDHCFHLDCLKDWLSRKNSCPLCQHDNVGYPKMKRKACGPAPP